MCVVVVVKLHECVAVCADLRGHWNCLSTENLPLEGLGKNSNKTPAPLPILA